ncbi:NAD(P)/FAD-dependent oxidoreductase [Blastococcus haudaquaticus]|uniref:NADH dehydrogenase n=1 Tax=Blastococcus haudaquaticus TaxID=1938745 RepID=A0A286GPY0_9ACTN|nr:FAD-dependent oxidoreductase [Blastococcus haudaquaticus]SOD97583.1 NADH dehydrogenase [Blastococcus haudaquaticus]
MTSNPTRHRTFRPAPRRPFPGERRPSPPAPRIVVVGGGFVGLTLARRLERRLRRGEAEVVLVDASPSMTYQPFLAEVAGGRIEARHVAVPLRTTLRGTRVLTGRATAVNHDQRRLHVTLPDGTTMGLDYDELVLAPGSVSRTQAVPGLAGHAIGFTTLADALRLRDAVLTRLALAADTEDVERRRAALAFVVVGGGYTGVEAMAELQDLARSTARRYPGLDTGELRFELVETDAEIMPELPSRLGAYTRARLAGSGITVRLKTQVTSMVDGLVELSDGERFRADTVVWAAGVRGNPLLARIGLPVDPRGRLRTRPTLQVDGVAHLWAAGDGAAVPDLAAAGPADVSAPMCGATAQHAVRQAKVLARNLLATLRGRDLVEYRHRDAGSVAGLGLHRGVARIYGVPLRGLPAWLLHRVYHLAMMPTWGRKERIVLDWTAALLGRRDLTAADLVPGGLAARTDARAEVPA